MSVVQDVRDLWRAWSHFGPGVLDRVTQTEHRKYFPPACFISCRQPQQTSRKPSACFLFSFQFEFLWNNISFPAWRTALSGSSVFSVQRTADEEGLHTVGSAGPGALQEVSWSSGWKVLKESWWVFRTSLQGVLKVFECVPGIFSCFFEGPQAAGETARVPEDVPEVLQGIQESWEDFRAHMRRIQELCGGSSPQKGLGRRTAGSTKVLLCC